MKTQYTGVQACLSSKLISQTGLSEKDEKAFTVLPKSAV